MNEILRRRNLFLIPKNMKKIVDFTLTEENYSEYTKTEYGSNLVYVNTCDDGKPLKLTKGWVLIIDIKTDPEWTSSSKPSFFVFSYHGTTSDNGRRELIRSLNNVVVGSTKSTVWAKGECLEDATVYSGAYYFQQYIYPDSPSKTFFGCLPLGDIRQIALSFSSFAQTVGTRIRIYSD